MPKSSLHSSQWNSTDSEVKIDLATAFLLLFFLICFVLYALTFAVVGFLIDFSCFPSPWPTRATFFFMFDDFHSESGVELADSVGKGLGVIEFL